MAFFDFLHGPEHVVSSAAKGTVNFVRPFVSGVTNLAKAGAKDTYALNPASLAVRGAQAEWAFLHNNTDAATKAVQPIRTTINDTVGGVQAIPRAAVQVASSVPGIRHDAVTSTNPVATALIGHSPVPSLESVYSQKKQVSGSPAQAAGETAFTSLADALALYGGAKGAHEAVTKVGAAIKPVFADEGVPGKIPAPILDKLATSKSVGEVKALLQRGLPEDVAQRIAPAIAQTKDPGIIQNIVDSAQPHLPNTAPNISDVSNPNVHAAGTPVTAISTNHPGLISDVANPAQATEAPRGPSISDVSNPAQVGQPTPITPVDIRQASVPSSGESVLGNAALKTAAQDKSALPTPSGTTPNTGIQKIVDALGGSIGKLNKQQADLYGAERSARLAKSYGSTAGLTGREATKAQLAALSGKLPRVDATALLDDLHSKVSPEDVNGILDTVRTSPSLSGYEPITGQNAIIKLFDEGKLPAPHEWEILKKSLGTDFTDHIAITAVDSMSNLQKIKNFGVQVLGMPKAVMASLDFSGGGRQGAVLGSRFPKEFVASQIESVKYFASDQAFKDGMAEIAARPNASLYKKMKLNLALPGTAGHEEAFASTLAEKIPGLGRGVAASDRAYTGGLSRLRADSADNIITNLRDAGIDPATLGDKEIKSLGRFINTASGRGDLGILEKHAQSLGEALFSPRLWKSRLDMLNPKYYYDLKGPARTYALQAAGSFAAVTATIMGLAVMAGGEVETDARSSDFLKIKFGNTRYDVLGGFQQNLVFAWREIKGEKKSSTTGSVTKLGSGYGSANRLSILGDLIQNKENPVLSTSQRILKGTDASGQPVNPATEISKLFVPLGIQDTYQTIKDTGSIPKGIAKALPGEIGVGVNTYGTSDIGLTPKQKATIDQLAKNGASPEVQAAYKSYYQTAKVASGKRQNAEDAIRNALVAGDIKKAQNIAEAYNQEYKTGFNDWSKKYGKYSDKTIGKDYTSGKINLTSASIKSRLKAIKNNPLYAK